MGGGLERGDTFASRSSAIARVNNRRAGKYRALLVCPLPHKMAAERNRARGKEAF